MAKCGSGCKIIPNLEHVCGFYALYNAHMIPHFPESSFTAAIEVHGRLILGTKGFRASNAKIIGLVPDGLTYALIQLERKFDYDELIRSVQLRYGVPIFKDIDDLMTAFPPTDMSAYGIPKEESYQFHFNDLNPKDFMSHSTHARMWGRTEMMRQMIGNGILHKNNFMKVNWIA